MNFNKHTTYSSIKKLIFGLNQSNYLNFFRWIACAVFVFLLMSFLVLPLQSTYTSIQYRKKILRKEIKRKIIAGLKEGELVKLKFLKVEISKKLKWKHSREFEFNGQMYDIVNTKISADSVEYQCWWDSEESDLNRKLIALIAKKLPDLPGSRELSFQLTNFYKTFYFNSIKPLIDFESQFFSCYFNTNLFFEKPDRITQVFQNINIPPPKI